MRWSRFSLFIVLSLLAISIVLTGFGRSPLALIEQLPGSAPKLTPGSSAVPLVQPVDGDRLFRTVEALALERFDENQRQQTRRYIMEQLQEAGWSPQEQPFSLPRPDSDEVLSGVNIVAVHPGQSPQAGSLLVGAHYDSVGRSPGADDNASGVAVLLELARILPKEPSPRGLTLAVFDLEEMGLLGSQAFVNASPLVNDLRGAIILEMLGYACDRPGCQRYPEGLPVTPPSDVGNFLAAVGDLGHGFLVDAFEQQSPDDIPPLVTLRVPTWGPLLSDLMRSDHVPFWEAGIGAVMLTDTANFRNPHYHQPSDRPETLNPEFLQQSATAVARAIARLMNAA